MKPALLNWLVCPACKGDLRCDATERRGEEIVTGRLACTACGATYEVLRGVPRMAPTFTSVTPDEQKQTAEAFGYEWQHFDAVHDTYATQFLEWVDPLQPEDFKDQLVLDAGCGMGRHTRITAGFGTRATIGIDLSEAVEAAYRNTAHLPNAHIVQADINRLPFRAPFDLIYSVGVLHHTPDPARSFTSLVGHLRDGGRIAAWVYGAEGNFLVARVLTPFREAVTARIPLRALHALSWIPAALAFPFLKTVFKALKRRPDLRKRVEWIPYLEYLCYLSDFGLDQLHSIVFDHLAPSIAFYLTRRDMEAWVARNRLTDARIAWHKRYSWRLLGTKPAASHGQPTTPELTHAAA